MFQVRNECHVQLGVPEKGIMTPLNRSGSGKKNEIDNPTVRSDR